MKKQIITFKTKDFEIEIEPLNNGKCQYLVSVHDYGNLESLCNRVLDYNQLQECLNEYENYIPRNKYVY